MLAHGHNRAGGYGMIAPMASDLPPEVPTVIPPDDPLAGLRVGTGTDVHRLEKGRPMRVAGLSFPEETHGPAGHSDGDVVLHAACDALLSAAGLGDLGTHFGTADPRWADADSQDLLAETLRRLRTEGWEVLNVSAQLIGNRPRFAARRAEAEQAVHERHRIRVSFSATTTDGLGLTGRGEGIAATATALVRRAPGREVRP